MIELEGVSTPEVHLWRAVIVQAMTDATMNVRLFDGPTTSKQSKIVENIRERADSRRWLLDNSRDFRRVCELAMLDPAAVRDSAMKLSKDGWPRSMTKEWAYAADVKSQRKRAFRKRAAA